MIDAATVAQILRLSHAERWPVGTIATQLGLHHDTVERVLEEAGRTQARRPRPCRIDRFVPFIEETWAKYPRLCASRLYHMCVARGYVAAGVKIVVASGRVVKPLRRSGG